MRKIINLIDDWLLARHQAAADWAYTFWDVSPYQIAAQIFGAVATLLVIREGLAFAANGIIGRMPSILFSPFTLLFSALYWRIALRAHENWKAGRLVWTPANEAMVRVALGWMFAALAFVSGPLIVAAPDWPQAIISTTLLLSNLASASGFYWLACNGPTKRKRSEAIERLPILEPTA